MPSFADSIFLFVLALLLFGPKKLPVLARELGKWVGEFRRASNEFKMQMEDELRASEQAERQKQIVAMEAAAPLPPPLEESAEEGHPHLRPAVSGSAAPPPLPNHLVGVASEKNEFATDPFAEPAVKAEEGVERVETSGAGLHSIRPLPIATSGDLHMMPPATGLPISRGRGTNPFGGGLLDAIPDTLPDAGTEIKQETAAHGD